MVKYLVTTRQRTWISAVTVFLSIISVTVSQLNCDFEKDECQWESSNQSGASWNRTQAPKGRERTGPLFDHTGGKGGRGWYMSVEDNGTATLGSKTNLKKNQNYCLSFWLFMYGPYDQTFQLKAAGKTLINKKGDHGDSWLPITVELPVSEIPYKPEFVSIQSSAKTNHLSIDDIKIAEGSCPKQVGPGCTFEFDFCDWSSASPMNRFQLTRQQYSPTDGIPYDHTLQTKQGYSITAKATQRQHGGIVGIRSAPLKMKEAVCMKFFYFFSTEGDNHLYVQSKGPFDSKPQTVWMDKGSLKNMWLKGEVTLFNPLNSQVTLVFKIGILGAGKLGLDDVSFSSEECPFRGNYGFELGLDRFYNADNSDFNWVVGNQEDPKFQWLRRYDATLQTVKGHFAIATPTSQNPKGQKAILMSPRFPASSVGYCTMFYLLVIGNDPGTLSIDWISHSSDDVKTVLTYSPKPNKLWSNVVRFPVAYKDSFQMRFTVIMGRNGSWALDEIQTFALVPQCTVRPTDAIGADPLATPVPTKAPIYLVNCNFDKDLCQLKTSWILSGSDKGTKGWSPQHDHTSGKGEYIHLGDNKKASITVSNKAGASSSSECFSFWYFMNEVVGGGLKVYIDGDVSNTLMFEGNKQTENWKHVQLHVHGYLINKVMIEGAKGQTGDISIDDLVWSSSVCTDNTAQLCSFEEADMCGFHQDKSDDLDWNWRLTKDHTYSTARGHVMALNNQGIPGKVANIISSKLRPMAGCLALYWKTNSSWIVNIFVRKGTVQDLLIRKNSYGSIDNWSLIEAPVSSNSPFTIVIQGVTGDETDTGYLYIDDLQIHDGVCQNKGACKFENQLCSWGNDDGNSDFHWTLQKGKYGQDNKGPEIDSTIGNANGHYLLLDSNSLTKAGSKARYNSETFPKGFQKCMEFMFNINGTDLGSLNVFSVQVPSGKRELLWSVNADQGDAWKRASVTVTSMTSNYFVQIEGVLGSSSVKKIAIDDILFYTEDCDATPPDSQDFKKSNHTTVAPAATSPPSPTPTGSWISTSPFDCTFEGFCQWDRDPSALGYWENFAAEKILPQLKDHTLRSGKGHLLTPSPYSVKRTAIFVSPTIPGGSYCFTMYVKGDYTHAGNLKVNRKVKNLDVLLYSTREPTIQWREVRMNVGSKYPFKLQLESTRNTYNVGGLYLDDIKLINGSCPDETSNNGSLCDFEDGNLMCGYSKDFKGDHFWSLSHGNIPIDDHTTQTMSGHFMFSLPSKAKPGEKGRIVSPTYQSDGKSPQCLSFFYHLEGDGSIGAINVYIAPDLNGKASPLGTVQWSRNYSVGQEWNKAFVPIQGMSKYHVVFESVRGGAANIIYGIDDVEIIQGNCPDTTNCTFESGMCLWTMYGGNVRTNLDWALYQASEYLAESAPEVDHTTNGPDGHYLLIEANGVNRGNKARLYSQVFPHSNGISYSFSFWYLMYGGSIGVLKVYVQSSVTKSDPSSEVQLMETSTTTNNAWKSVVVDIPLANTASDYQIILEGIIGNSTKGHIAIDDAVFIVTSQVSTSSPIIGPTTKTPKPTTKTTKPTIKTTKPTIKTTKPTTNTPKPTTNTPNPTTKTPKPTTNTPKPSIKTIRPATKTPKPSTKTPKPTTITPKPSIKTPKPTTNTPKPSIKTIRPITNTPKPTSKTPGPTTKSSGLTDFRQADSSTKLTSSSTEKSNTDKSKSGKPDSGGNNIPMIAGASGGGVVLLAAIIVGVVVYRRKARDGDVRRMLSEASGDETNFTNPIYGTAQANADDDVISNAKPLTNQTRQSGYSVEIEKRDSFSI